jgi:large subunit ribosomal protein L6e
MADVTPTADAAAAAEPSPSATKTPSKGAVSERKRRGRQRNYDLGSGVYRFSRSRMYHKKALYKFVGKKTEKKVQCIKLYECLEVNL